MGNSYRTDWVTVAVGELIDLKIDNTPVSGEFYFDNGVDEMLPGINAIRDALEPYNLYMDVREPLESPDYREFRIRNMDHLSHSFEMQSVNPAVFEAHFSNAGDLVIDGDGSHLTACIVSADEESSNIRNL